MLYKKPVNQFKQQLLIATGRYTIHEMVNKFENTRHKIEFDTPENLVSILREYVPNKAQGTRENVKFSQQRQKGKGLSRLGNHL